MTIQAEKAKLKSRAIFEVNKAIETLFFKNPLSLDLLKSAVMLALLKLGEKLLEEILTRYGNQLDFDPTDKKSLEQYIKTNPDTKQIIEFSTNSLNEDILNDLLLKCQIAKQTNDTSGFESISIPIVEPTEESISNYINDISNQNENDLLSKINDLIAKLNLTIDTLLPYLSAALMVYYIIQLMIQLFDYTDFPSEYRVKYIGKLIRTTIASIGTSALNELKGLISNLKIIDSLMVAVVTATTLYLINRKKLQKTSREQLIDNICPDYPKDILEPFDIIVQPSTFNENNNLNNCPIDIDEVIVPKESFEAKLERAQTMCDLPEESVDKPLGEAKPLIVTNAIIENKRIKNMNILIQPNAKITDSTVIATLDNHKIYSPVNGTVSSVEPNKIIVKDLKDISQSYLEKNITDLTELYTRLNDAKSFIKTWVIPTIYPNMLANSPSNDNVITPEESAVIKYTGINKKWIEIQNAYKNDLNIFNNNVQDITGEANVKIHAENETLEILEQNIKKEEDILIKKIIYYNTSSIGTAKLSKAIEGEYILVDYYFDLVLQLSGINNKTSYEISLFNLLSSFLRKRLTMDNLDSTNITNKIGVLGNNLLGEFAIDTFFLDGLDIYKKSNKLADIEDWLKTISIQNKAISDSDKTSLISKIYFLYEFYLNIPEYLITYASLSQDTRNMEVIKEAKNINSLVNKIFLDLEKIPKQIVEKEIIIDDISTITTFSTISIKGVLYNQYLIAETTDKNCKPADLDVNLGGPTITDFTSMKYWRKYCALATLVSIASPGVGWATGFVGPTGPILFPIIYIPFKAIQTPYGFIVFGLTITGVVLMPFVLFVNYGTNFELPLIDPVKALKNEISSLKLNLSSQLEDFKLVTLKALLDIAKKDLDEANINLDNINEVIKIYKTKKPPKTKKYLIEHVEWNTKNLEYIKIKVGLSEKKFIAAARYSIIYILYTVGGGLSEKVSDGVDSLLNSIKSTEKLINNQFDILAQMVENLEKIIGPLPITLLPDSANFGFTPKMPIPLFNFATNLSVDHIQLTILDDILSKFKINNETLMSIGGAIINYKELKDLLQITLSLLIINDPFPAYEKLSLSNIGFSIFLFSKFVPGGARSFGLPGFP